MLIEDYKELLNAIDYKRLHDISELQKCILRRQNRYKRILTLHIRLFEKWEQLSYAKDVTEEKNENQTMKKLDDQEDDVFESCFDMKDEYNTDQNMMCNVHNADTVDITGIRHNENMDVKNTGSNSFKANSNNKQKQEYLQNSKISKDETEKKHRSSALSSDSSFDSGFFEDNSEDSDNNFEDYHNLLLRIMAKHLEDFDQLTQHLDSERSKEEETKRLILEERSHLDLLQDEIAQIYKSESKVARTIHASKTPSRVYVGFMENVLQGMKTNDVEIDFHEYSTYCQVKWTLENVETEFYTQSHKMFDQRTDLNRVDDQISDNCDCIYAMVSFKSYVLKKNLSRSRFKQGFIKNLFSDHTYKNIYDGEPFKNLYNIYGFDQHINYNDSSYLEDSIGDKCIEKESTKQITCDLDDNNSFMQYLRSPATDPLSQSESGNIEALRDAESISVEAAFAHDAKIHETIEHEMDRLTENVMEVLSEAKLNILKNLDGSLKRQQVENVEMEKQCIGDSYDNPNYSRSNSTSVSPNPMNETRRYESPDQLITKKKVTKSASAFTETKPLYKFPQRSSSENSSNSPPLKTEKNSHQSNDTNTNRKLGLKKSSSDGSNGNVSRRRLGTRRHKLPSSSKELFFLPPSDIDDVITQYESQQSNATCKDNISGDVQIIRESGSTSRTQQNVSNDRYDTNNNNVENGNLDTRVQIKPTLSQHKKLCRVKPRNAITPEEVQKLTDELNGKKLINIQTIVVDGERMKIADLSLQRFENLSVKNRPRKLSIKNKYRGRNK